MSTPFQEEVSLELYHHVCQFYYAEARILDERKYQRWLELLAEDVAYIMPARHVPMLDPALRETEGFLDVSHDTGNSKQVPLREDNFLTLNIRVMRSFKLNSWSDNPPPRTTRIVSNIEVMPHAEGFEVFSNVALAYSRYGGDNMLYTARRQDVIRVEGNSFRIASRKVVLDWNIVEGPSVGMFF